MNQVSIRRAKIAKQVQLASKHQYFKQIRESILEQRAHLNLEQTQYEKEIRLLIRKSMLDNQLLLQLRQKGLLNYLRQVIDVSGTPRDIECVLVLLSNMLMDEVTVDQKQSMVELSLSALHCHTLKNYIKHQLDTTSMLYLTFTLFSLTYTLTYIDQQLSVKCQTAIFQHIVTIANQLVLTISQRNHHHQPQYQNILDKIIQRVILILKHLLVQQPEEIGFVASRFNRSQSYFRDLLQYHRRLLPCLPDPQAAHLHHGFLQIYNVLSQSIDIPNHPMYFEEQFLYICLQESLMNRRKDWTKLALCCLIKVVEQYKQNIIPLLAPFQQVNPSQLFKALINNDSHQLLRLTLLQQWISNDSLFQLIQEAFSHYWKDAADFCCQLLNSEPQDILQTDIALSALICTRQRVNIIFKGAPNFYNYLQSIGGQSILEYLMTTLQEQRSRSDKQLDETFEPLDDKCYQLLSKFSQSSL